MNKRQVQMTIYADHGERASGILERLEARGVKVIVRKLPVADFVISERVAVERKTASDFLQSIKGKRLFRQIIDLKENFERPIFILEGGHNLYELGGIKPAGIRGAISLITVLEGIPIIFTKDAFDSAEYLYIITKQEQIGLSEEVSLRAKKLSVRLAEQQRYIVEAFPQLGPKLADALLRHFGSLQNFVSASEAQLREVPKIGKIKARRIRELLMASYI